jgi:hypothetical protein
VQGRSLSVAIVLQEYKFLPAERQRQTWGEMLRACCPKGFPRRSG